MKSRLILLLLAISTNFGMINAQNNQWNYYGPPHDFFDGYPRLGLVRSVYTSDYSGDVMIAASNTAGMYRTNDGGISWVSVTDDLGVPGLGITDISSDPAVRDEMGRVIQQDQLKGGVGYIPLSTAQMKRGVYLCSVFFDGIHVSTEKIIKL